MSILQHYALLTFFQKLFKIEGVAEFISVKVKEMFTDISRTATLPRLQKKPIKHNNTLKNWPEAQGVELKHKTNKQQVVSLAQYKLQTKSI